MTSDHPATITLRLHGVLQDIVGAHVLPVETKDGPVTPAAVFERAILAHPGLSAYRTSVAFGNDHEVIASDGPIPASIHVIEVLPPISGG